MAEDLGYHDYGDSAPRCEDQIEERRFNVALQMMESWFIGVPPIGSLTREATVVAIRETMEKTLNKPDVR